MYPNCFINIIRDIIISRHTQKSKFCANWYQTINVIKNIISYNLYNFLWSYNTTETIYNCTSELKSEFIFRSREVSTSFGLLSTISPMFGGVADHSWCRGDFPVVLVAALGTASSYRGQSLLERHACKFYNFTQWAMHFSS